MRRTRLRAGIAAGGIAFALLVSLVAFISTAKAEAVLSVEVLSFQYIGIDSNEADKFDPLGNPIGPDKNLVQARISNTGSDIATNVFASFQWTGANVYVRLSDYETLIKYLGDIAPGGHKDVFFVVEIARDLAATNTTRPFRIDATSDQSAASATQTLTVKGLAEQGQDDSSIVQVPSTIYLGETFEVVAQASDTRTIAHLTLPLQYDRKFFELESVRLDYYGTQDCSGPVLYSETDIYFSDGAIPYKGVMGYYTLKAIRPGIGKFTSLQIDASSNLASFHYNATMWEGSVNVVASNADLTISLTDSPDPILPGANINYTATYANAGNAEATNTSVSIFIPADSTYVSGSAASTPSVPLEYFDGLTWTSSEPATVIGLRWTVGTLAGGVSGQTVSFQAAAYAGLPEATSINCTAAIHSDQMSSTDSTTTTVSTLPGPIVTKTDSPDPVEPGAAITYTISYGNETGQTLTSVVIEDWVPEHTVYVGGSSDGGGLSKSYYYGGTWNAVEPADPWLVEAVRWSVGTVAAGAGGQVSFQAIALYDVPGGTVISNTVVVMSDQSTRQDISATTTINEPPIVVDDSYQLNEDQVLNVSAPGVLANDYDNDGGTLEAILITGPAHGTLVLNQDGSFTYTPQPNYFGTDSFEYRANDGSAMSVNSPALVSLTIHPVNDPPVAANDSYSVDEDGYLTVTSPGVLGNDYDVDGDALTAVMVSEPEHGSLSLQPDGSFAYTPFHDYFGPDSFSYQAHDGVLGSNTATVSITVSPIDDPPVATDDLYTVMEDHVLTVSAPGVLGNDTDVDGDPLEAQLRSAPAHGSLILASDGSFAYTPHPNFFGIDTFTYRAFDGYLQSNDTTVTITVESVNDPPVAVGDSYTTSEDTTLVVNEPGVLGNDTDIEGDTLFAHVVSGTSHGTLTLNGDGSFSYTPHLNYYGPDSFTYMAYDGTDYSGIATVSLTISPVNDSPLAGNDFYAVAEDGLLNVTAPGLLLNDFDIDGDPLTAHLVSGTSHGALILNTDGSFTYTPAQNFHGSDTFTYRAYDGQAYSAEATVTITINPVNDPPVANGDSCNVYEDDVLSVEGPGVLSNDTDVEGDPLSAELVSSPSHGHLLLSANGSFTYTPHADYHGSDTFTYRVFDGTEYSNYAQVFITVIPVNDPPVAVNDSYTTAEDTVLQAGPPGVLANDSDVDGDALTAVLGSGPAHGTLSFNGDGSFMYTPDADFYGSDLFTYQVSDGLLASNVATVYLTVTPVNDAPVAAGESYILAEDATLDVAAPGVLSNDADVDGDPLTATPASSPSHGTLTLNPNGSFIYTPHANYYGQDSFTYHAFDGDLYSNTATVTLQISPVNDAPIAVNDAYTVIEDQALSVPAPGVLTNDGDVDLDVLSAVLTTSTTSGTLTFNSNGSFLYTPNPGYVGQDSFTYRAWDGNLYSNTATVTINVVPANQAPVAHGDAYTVNEDTRLTVAAPGVLANDTDPEGDLLRAYLVSGPSHGNLSLAPDGSFVYDPAPDYYGPDSFTYRCSDGLSYSNTATVSITVNPVNDPPQAATDYYYVDEDNLLVVGAPGVLANDADKEGQSLTAVLVSTTSSGSLSLNADGSFSYQPNAGFSGMDWFTYRASDGLSQSNLATVYISVADMVHIRGFIYDSGGSPVSGVQLLLKDPDGTVLDSSVSSASETYDLSAYPGTYEVWVDAIAGAGVELVFQAVSAWTDILDGHITIGNYLDCPHRPPREKLHVKSKEIAVSTSLVDGVVLRIHYTDEEVISAKAWEQSLRVYHWNGIEWEQMPTQLNMQENVVSVNVRDFSPYGIFGDSPPKIPVLPGSYGPAVGALFAGILACFIRLRRTHRDIPPATE